MSDNIKYFLLGALLTLAAFAMFMPFMARDPAASGRLGPGIYLPYYAHGGRAYRPGVLY